MCWHQAFLFSQEDSSVNSIVLTTSNRKVNWLIVAKTNQDDCFSYNHKFSGGLLLAPVQLFSCDI